MRLDNNEKKDLRASLANFVKTSKSNKKKQISCLSYVLKYWRV